MILDSTSIITQRKKFNFTPPEQFYKPKGTYPFYCEVLGFEG